MFWEADGIENSRRAMRILQALYQTFMQLILRDWVCNLQNCVWNAVLKNWRPWRPSRSSRLEPLMHPIQFIRTPWERNNGDFDPCPKPISSTEWSGCMKSSSESCKSRGESDLLTKKIKWKTDSGTQFSQHNITTSQTRFLNFFNGMADV